VAVPSLVAKFTLTAKPLATDSETVKVQPTWPPVPSGIAQSETETAGGGSLSTIVPTPCPSATVALVGDERLTKKFSVGSSARSPVTGTTTSWLGVLGGKVSVPEPAV